MKFLFCEIVKSGRKSKIISNYLFTASSTSTGVASTLNDLLTVPASLCNSRKAWIIGWHYNMTTNNASQLFIID